jgi:protein farnesyltransferase/geranylgeranyltransferase type-1 subunit alpha
MLSHKIIIFNFTNCSLFDNELTFIDKLLSIDVRNNSAWNQRFFVLKHLGLTKEAVQIELVYVMNRIRLIKNNESSWNYLKGLLEYDDYNISQFPEVESFVEELYNAGNRSPYLLAFLVDMYIEKTLHIYAINSYDDPEHYASKVYELCEMLANHYDTIRYKYWKYVNQQFRMEKEIAKLGPNVTAQNDNESSPSKQAPEQVDEVEPECINPEEQKLNGDSQ